MTTEIPTSVDSITMNPSKTKILVTLIAERQLLIVINAVDGSAVSASFLMEQPLYRYTAESSLLTDDGTLLFSEVHQDPHDAVGDFSIGSYLIDVTLAVEVVQKWRLRSKNKFGRASSISLTSDANSFLVGGTLEDKGDAFNVVTSINKADGARLWMLAQS